MNFIFYKRKYWKIVMDKYRLTYPEKNAQWITTTPNKCIFDRKEECAQKNLFKPTPANNCNSTFMPWNRPKPDECLKMCGKKDPFAITACMEEQWKFPRRINNNGCIMEPSVAQYTNVSFSNANRSTSILTNNQRNPPSPPQYGYKDSNAYDPILYVYGKSYTF